MYGLLITAKVFLGGGEGEGEGEEASFWVSENNTGWVHFESHSLEWRVLSVLVLKNTHQAKVNCGPCELSLHTFHTGQFMQCKYKIKIEYLRLVSVLNLVLSYGAPTISTSTNGDAIPRPDLTRCLAAITYKSHSEYQK